MDERQIDQLIEKIQDGTEPEAYKYSDQLAEIGGEYVMNKMIELLYDQNEETQYLAARTLSKIKDNHQALDPLLEAINDRENRNYNGHLVEALDGFDCSGKFVEVFKLYLFGNFKASAMAKLILDSEEFDITPRVIKKAEKHWYHFIHNTPHDEAFETKKTEVEAILGELKALFE